MGLKVTDFIIIANSVEKKQLKPLHWLIKKFPDTYTFINKFILLSRKGDYPYEYMDSCERFTETTLPNKKAFYSKLYLEDITDEGYIYAPKVLEKKILKERKSMEKNSKSGFKLKSKITS